MLLEIIVMGNASFFFGFKKSRFGSTDKAFTYDYISYVNLLSIDFPTCTLIVLGQD